MAGLSTTKEKRRAKPVFSCRFPTPGGRSLHSHIHYIIIPGKTQSRKTGKKFYFLYVVRFFLPNSGFYFALLPVLVFALLWWLMLCCRHNSAFPLSGNVGGRLNCKQQSNYTTHTQTRGCAALHETHSGGAQHRCGRKQGGRSPAAACRSRRLPRGRTGAEHNQRAARQQPGGETTPAH